MPTQDIILGYAKGKPGNAATVEIGTTTTLEPGSQATVNNSGNENAAVFNFGIPKGEEGKAASIMIDSVQTLQPEENATVENVGTTSDVILKFGIPRGADGMTDLVARYEDASEYTATPTSDAPIVINDMSGKTQQTTTNGYQLFDASKLPSKTQGGATVTNNGDGSFTVSGSGEISDVLNNTIFYGDASILKEGNLYLSKELETYPFFNIAGCSEKGNSSTNLRTFNLTTGQSINITPEIIENTKDILFNFYGGTGKTIVPGTIKPMLYQDGDGTWEPFSGGVASPSPDWEQRIAGVGDMGYFDGILQKGYYNASGVYTSADNYVCTVNKIECKQSDSINVELETSATSIIVSFFQSSGTFISQQTGSGKSLTATAPANAGYCMISINRASIEPQTAGHISVTINGKYQTGVEVTGKNLAEVTLAPGTHTIGGVTMNLKDDGSFTLNGTSLVTFIFQLNQPDGSDYMNFPAIFKMKANKKYRIKKTQLFIRNNSNLSTTVAGVGVSGNDVIYTPNIDYDVIGIRAHITQGETFNGNEIYYPGIWEDETETDDKWQPYRHTSIQFPLTSPIYDGDKICYVKPGESYIDENGDTVVADRMLYGHYHDNGRVVFDGSEDESWSFVGIERNNRATITIKNSNNNYDNESAKCNLLKYNRTVYEDLSNIIGFIVASNKIFIRFGSDSEINSLEALKTWLQSNNLEVVYKLAQPWFEPFEDQTPFYNLRSFDNLTYIYSDDPLNPALTVDVAKNQTGGYIFESLAQVMKNAQKAESMQSLESRIQALESQAVENI